MTLCTHCGKRIEECDCDAITFVANIPWHGLRLVARKHLLHDREAALEIERIRRMRAVA